MSTTPAAENKDNPPRVRANRRIDKSVIEAVAALVSRGLTESEACRQLNIRPKSYFNFKSTRRNDERFKELLEEFRASRVQDLIAEIECSAFGKGMKQRDWRAAKFLLEVLDRNRFNTDKPAVEITGGSVGILSDARMKEIADDCERQRAAIGVVVDIAPAQLPPAALPDEMTRGQ